MQSNSSLNNSEIIIGHTADSHIDELTGPENYGVNLRLEDTKRCLNDVLAGFRKNKVDLIIHAGDLFDKAKLWSDRTFNNYNIAVDFMRSCAEIAPTVIIVGTDTHDNPKAFHALINCRIPNLYVITEPRIEFISTKKGFIQVAGFPVIDSKNFMLSELMSDLEDDRVFANLPIAEQNAILSRGLAAGVTWLDGQLNLAHPSILVLHYEIQGCERENGSAASRKNDVIMPLAELVNTNFNLICVGHIHKAQRIPALKPIYYSGPPTGIDFGEEDQSKGFYIHRLNLENKVVNSEFVETSYRRFMTINLDSNDIAFWNKNGNLDHDPGITAGIKDTITRINYSCPDSENKLFNKRQFEQYLYSQGAFFVHSITPENIAISTVKQTMNENDGIIENLKSWLADYFLAMDAATRPTPEEQQKIIDNILTLAQPIITLAGAKSPSGKLSGVFSLKSLRVANYRMHRNSEIDFTKINFAIINGKNGTGKSSFFSDALVDGFFEDSRGGKDSEVGSWITNGQWDGLIEIVFELNSTWRVIRQRSRRGQGGIKLNLDEWTGEKWESRSGTSSKETQAKINALLGMDVDTFRCIASIQQNRYDEFFRADRKDRMRILCAILGIGVYETIMEIAQDRRKDVNREIGALKEKVETLNKALAGRDAAGVELASIKVELEKFNGELVEKEAEYQEIIKTINTLSLEIQRAQETQKQINELNREIGEKRDLVNKQNDLIQRANTLLANREKIETGAAECERLKIEKAGLEAKKPQLESLKQQERQFNDELCGLRDAEIKLTDSIQTLEKVLANQDFIKQNAELYKEKAQRARELNDLSKKYWDQKIVCGELEKKMIAETNRLKYEYSQTETAIKQATQKADMLTNSDCIDSTKASCRFLSDAQTANSSLPELRAKLEELTDSELNRQLIEQVKQAQEDSLKIIFDPTEFEQIKSEVAQLAPFVEQAAQLESKKELLENYRGQLNDNLEKQKAVKEQKNDVSLQISGLQAELDLLASIDSKIIELGNYTRLKEQIPAAEQAIQSAQEQIKVLKAEIADKQSRADLLKLELPFTDKQNELTIANKTKSTLELSLNSLRQNINVKSVAQGRLESQIEAFQKQESELVESQKNLAALTETWNNYNLLIKACGFDGVPLAIIRNVIPELTNRANYILGQMSRGTMSLDILLDKEQANGKEVPCLDVMVNEIYSGSLSFAERSGGEKVRAGLAFAFALSDIKARRIGIQVAFMSVDEPPFLDEEGTEAYCDALEWLNGEFSGMQVVAISHDPRMKARFRQEIVCWKDDSGSHLKVAA